LTAAICSTSDIGAPLTSTDGVKIMDGNRYLVQD
jgi:hypothetical protein